MVTIARVKYCEGFIKALKDAKNFPDLHMYCRTWANNLSEDDTMLCKVVDDIDIRTGKPEKSLDIELSLFDYFFNVSNEKEDKERENLWNLVDNKLTRKIINTVTI